MPSSCIIADIILESILLIECVAYILTWIPGDPTFQGIKEMCISLCQDSSKIHSDKALNPHHYKEGSIIKQIGSIWWNIVKFKNIYVIVLIATDKFYINYIRHNVTDEPNRWIASLIWLLPLTIIIIAYKLTWIIPPVVVASLSTQITMAMHITQQFIGFSVGLLIGGIIAYLLGQCTQSVMTESAIVYSTVAILSSFLIYQLHDYNITKSAPNCMIICDYSVHGDVTIHEQVNPFYVLIYFIVVVTFMMIKSIIIASFSMCNYNTCACQQCWCKCLDRCAKVKSPNNNNNNNNEEEQLRLIRGNPPLF